jgi:hypothetical protein
MKLPHQRDHRLREFRTSPITAPEREFVFQVVEATRSPGSHFIASPTVHGNARVTVREDPQCRGRVLVTAWGDNIRVVWRGRDE